jgi:hypothetical protein
MQLNSRGIDLLVQIVEHLLVTSKGGPVEPAARTACVNNYVQLCSLSPDEPIDHYITSPSTGGLYKIHLPANPEGFLSQLFQPLIIRRDPLGLRALFATLNGCIQDPAVHPRVKLNILNVENSLLRQLVVTDLPAEELPVGRTFCIIRRALVLDVMGNPMRYFKDQDVAANESVLPSLYGLYVDTERDLYFRLGEHSSVMPFFDKLLAETRQQKEMLAGVFRSAIAANHRAMLITAEGMREKLDRYREWLDYDQMEQLDRMIEYGSEQNDLRSLTIQLANATFRGMNPREIYTVIQFVLPLELREDGSEAKRDVTFGGYDRFQILFRGIKSIYEDPTMMYLSNIGGEKIGGLPSSFLSDANPTPQTESTLVLIKIDRCLSLDFDVTADGVIIEKAFEDERALRGGLYFPHKELSINVLRALYREAPDRFPIKCGLEDLHIDAFSNFLVDYRLKDVGNIIVHRKSYLMTSRDAFPRACVRYSDKVGGLYRGDNRVSIKALMENSVIRTNESLRDFVYKALELTVKKYVEQQSCWALLWEGGTRYPKPETEVHPLLNSYLKTVLEIKGIRVSREVRTANGAVDFFCSMTTKRGDVLKVCVEVKNAHSSGLESGILKQLPAYMDAEQTRHGIYLVLWYKGTDWPKPEEFDSIEEMSTELQGLRPNRAYNIDLMVVNCVKPVPPSKM